MRYWWRKNEWAERTLRCRGVGADLYANTKTLLKIFANLLNVIKHCNYPRGPLRAAAAAPYPERNQFEWKKKEQPTHAIMTCSSWQCIFNYQRLRVLNSILRRARFITAMVAFFGIASNIFMYSVHARAKVWRANVCTFKSVAHPRHLLKPAYTFSITAARASSRRAV